jgi:RsiW-degrading membrane proteinase PrsW (M82 family)
VIAGLVLFKPSALTTPSLYFAYALLQAVLFLFLIRFLDLYEREPLSVVALMALWGGTVAIALSLVGNGIVSGALDQDLDLAFGSAISAPLVEEIAKGIALVAAFQLSYLASRRFGTLEFEGVTDGIVYGAAVGLGFALVEDVFYFFRYADQGVLAGLEVFRTRVDFFGATMLGHALYTAAFGAGLGLATWSRSRIARVGFPLLGLAVAMLLHAAWNGLFSLALWARFGWDTTVAVNGCHDGNDYCRAIPADVRGEIQSTADAAITASKVSLYLSLAAFAVGIAFWLRYQRQVIRFELAEEVNSGLIAREEWEIMPRYWQRTKWYWQLLRAGRLEQWRLVRRIHNELADLAFLKWRVRRLGADPAEVETRRRRIANLRAQVPGVV